MQTSKNQLCFLILIKIINIIYKSFWCFFKQLFFNIKSGFAQEKEYTVANAHSHNDYEQPNPFFEAYGEQFGSIEAAIFLMKNG